MPVDRASTSASSFGMAQVPSFPRNRESSFFDFVSSVMRRISPDGEFLFLLRQEKEPKEGDPDGPGRTSCDYPAMLVGTGRRGTRSRNLAVAFTQTSATDDPRPACASRRDQRGFTPGAQWCAFPSG